MRDVTGDAPPAGGARTTGGGTTAGAAGVLIVGATADVAGVARSAGADAVELGCACACPGPSSAALNRDGFSSDAAGLTNVGTGDTGVTGGDDDTARAVGVVGTGSASAPRNGWGFVTGAETIGAATFAVSGAGSSVSARRKPS